MTGNLGYASNAQSQTARFGEEALTIPARHPVAERRAEKQKYFLAILARGGTPHVRSGALQIAA